MNRKLMAFFAIGCLSISGCTKKTQDLTPADTGTIEVYAPTDLVNIHGILSDNGFPLKNLHFYNGEELMVTGEQLTWTGESDVAHVKDGVLYYDQIGRTLFKASYGGNDYQINVTVNKNEAERYLYENINVADAEPYFKVREGTANNVTFDRQSNSIILNASSGTTRVDYPIEFGFNYDYTIEADFKFISANDPTRYAGILFRTDALDVNSWYQMDVRNNVQVDVAGQYGVECTQKVGNSFLYPQRHVMDKPLPSFEDTKLRVEVSGMTAKFYINDELVIDTVLNSLTSGDIGFQVNGGQARFSNITIYTGTSNVTHTSDRASSYVNKENLASAFPMLSPNYATTEELNQAVNNNLILSYSLKAELENGQVIAQTFNGEKLGNLQTILSGYKGKLIPNMVIETVEVAQKVAKITASLGIEDCTVLSKDPNVLKAYYAVNPSGRLGYISSLSSIATYKQASQECFTAGEAHANIVCIDANVINKDIVFWINSRGYGAWAINMDSANALAPYQATLAGAGTFISTSQTEALKAVDSSIFHLGNALFRKPVITGHRGDGSNIHYPENSLESFLWAIENGASAIELDIHTTADNQLVVIHGGGSAGISTSETTTCSINMRDATLEQLKQCRLTQNGEATEYTIPSFDEVLDAFKDKDTILVVEIKDSRIKTAQLMLEALKEYDMMDRVVVIDFSTASLNYIKKVEPGLHVGYLNSVNVKSMDDYYNTYQNYFNKEIGLSPNIGNLTEDGIVASTSRGNNYWVWTFDVASNANFLNYIKYGNIAFTTNRVDLSSDWKIRFDSKEDQYSLTKGQSITLEGYSTTFKNQTNDETNFTIKVLSNDDIIEVSNQSITAKNTGTAYIILSYETTFTLGASNYYTIYSDIIEIQVQ